MSKKIGFIGIGLMGLPMAKNILKSGFNLKAFNRSQNKAETLKEFGAEISTSIDEVVKDCDVVITMLTDDSAINDVMDNPSFLEKLKSGSTVIDMSSVKPTTATKHGDIFKSKNINYLDAPVSGGTIGAEEGSLAIMVGGEQNVFDNVVDVFQTMGNPTLVGPVGSGQVSKLANQIIVGLTIGAVAEAVTLCEKAGANPNKMIKALSGGWADSKILQTHGKRMIDKDFTPKGRTSVHLKDMNNILECANSFNTHLPISNLVKEMYKTLVENGHGETDHSSLYKEIERINKKMSGRLEGKKIVVTAAGQGIGKATAIAFHNEGANVIATDLNDKTLADLNKEYPNIAVKTLDSTDNNAILEFVKNLDKVDVLFNAVGFVHHGSILECEDKDWNFSFDVNVKSMYQMCKAILPLMVKQNGGSIINVSSCASSLKGFPNRFVYGTTKGAVIGLTKSIAADFVKQNIRCNSIAPGTVFSPSWQDRVNQSPDPVQAKKDFIARQPMGRLGTAEEIAAVAVYLAGDDATFTTGTTISVDGGISI